MIAPNNIFNPIFSAGSTIGNDDFFEQRIENDSEGNPLYVAWTPYENGSVSEKIWYLKKLYYDTNGFVEHIQLPDDGPGFIYAWDQRATYFS